MVAMRKGGGAGPPIFGKRGEGGEEGEGEGTAEARWALKGEDDRNRRQERRRCEAADSGGKSWSDG